ncbi:MAG: cysteine desulfurase family protein [Chlamydiales bacterium]
MIYLDNNATTSLDPRVLAAMEPIYSSTIGNASSIHKYGQRARAILARARQDIASFFSVRPDELIFTSGATEALNMAIRSVPKGSHLITSSLEHVAVMEAVKFTGCTVTYLDPEPGKGAIGVEQIEKAIRPNTSMIVLMAANNETGIMSDIEAVATLAHAARIPLVIDGVALLGKEKFSLTEGMSVLCFSGHKIHAPTGIGLLIVKKPHKLHPFIVGGPQQFGMRGGTENLAGIVGFAKAIELIEQELPEAMTRMKTLRDHFEKILISNLPNLIIHGADQPRLCNTTNIAFLGMDGETLLRHLDLEGIAASHGSACSSGGMEPSRVLLNMGLSMEIARASIRFSLSRFTTKEEIERAAASIVDSI